MNVADVIKRARQIAKDIDGYRWPDDEEFLEELNDIMIEIGNELQLFKNNFLIDIFDGQSVYDYDETITELLEIRTKDYNGSVILPSSLQTFRATGRTDTSGNVNPFGNSDATTPAFSTVVFSDTVSYGKIRLDPTPLASTREDIEHVWTA